MRLWGSGAGRGKPINNMYFLYRKGDTMKIDLYTKIVLTVIAVCLIALVIRGTNFIKTVEAENVVPVRLVEVDTYAFTYCTVPVKAEDAVPVELVEVDTYAFTYCTVPVEVEGTVPVEVEGTVPVEVEGSVHVYN